MNEFSIQQLTAKNEAIESFHKNASRWSILLAQMQSGKTNAFLLIACEMIRLNLVSYAVIFSGNTETELRNQIQNQLDNPNLFFKKYRKYLSDEGVEELECESFIAELFSNKKLCVVWGGKLTSYAGPKTNTLFIWEESHFAQSKSQRPDKFLQSINISADGALDYLANNNNYVVSVSATPFSEISDNYYFDQHKHIIKMCPGENYVSVKDIYESGRIREFADMEGCMKSALSLDTHDKKWYGIIRTTKKYRDIIKKSCASAGWNCVSYDSVSNDIAGENAWNNMGVEPERNTVILIRGKCRMGQNLEKKHLLFAIDSSPLSRTDTVLQSFIGRVCGYSEGSDRVIVYLSKEIVKKGDIKRYINLWEADGIQVVPKYGNNLSNTGIVGDERFRQVLKEFMENRRLPNLPVDPEPIMENMDNALVNLYRPIEQYKSLTEREPEPQPINTPTPCIPYTSKREIFAHGLRENNINKFQKLSPQTTNNEEAMQQELSALIEESITQKKERQILPINTSILVSEPIYNSLNKKGAIYNFMLETHGVKLKLNRPRGKIPKEIAEKKLVRLSLISW